MAYPDWPDSLLWDRLLRLGGTTLIEIRSPTLGYSSLHLLQPEFETQEAHSGLHTFTEI